MNRNRLLSILSDFEMGIIGMHAAADLIIKQIPENEFDTLTGYQPEKMEGKFITPPERP